MDTCHACKRKIEGTSLIANSKVYHEHCFVCKNCKSPLHGSYILSNEGDPLCVNCKSSSVSKSDICFACNGPIIGAVLTAASHHYHPDCFKCTKCKIKLDVTFQLLGNEPICNRCATKEIFGKPEPHQIGTVNKNKGIACGICDKGMDSCSVVTALGKKFHSECFKCTNCKKQLTGNFNSPDNEKPYCLDCYTNKFSKKCHSCHIPISDQEFTVFEGKNYHHACFKCTICGKGLAGQPICMTTTGICCVHHNK